MSDDDLGEARKGYAAAYVPAGVGRTTGDWAKQGVAAQALIVALERALRTALAKVARLERMEKKARGLGDDDCSVGEHHTSRTCESCVARRILAAGDQS